MRDQNRQLGGLYTKKSNSSTLVAHAVNPAGDGLVTPLWIYRFADGRRDRGQPVNGLVQS